MLMQHMNLDDYFELLNTMDKDKEYLSTMQMVYETKAEMYRYYILLIKALKLGMKAGLYKSNERLRSIYKIISDEYEEREDECEFIEEDGLYALNCSEMIDVNWFTYYYYTGERKDDLEKSNATKISRRYLLSNLSNLSKFLLKEFYNVNRNIHLFEDCLEYFYVYEDYKNLKTISKEMEKILCEYCVENKYTEEIIELCPSLKDGIEECGKNNCGVMLLGPGFLYDGCYIKRIYNLLKKSSTQSEQVEKFFYYVENLETIICNKWSGYSYDVVIDHEDELFVHFMSFANGEEISVRSWCDLSPFVSLYLFCLEHVAKLLEKEYYGQIRNN